MWASFLTEGTVVIPSDFLKTKEGKEVKLAGLIEVIILCERVRERQQKR